MSEEEIKTSVERLHAYQQAIQEHQAKVWSSIARSALNNNPVTEAARGPSASEFNTAIVHLYRAEAAKAEAWRKRLDTTTNWAVVTTAAAISFALGGIEPERHIAILLVSVLVTFFLLLEARRYRHYDIWQTRVHLLEDDFFAPMLEPDGPPPHPNWQQLFAADLRKPQYHISFGEALGWRLRRNYMWLYVTHLITWFIKIAIHPNTIHSLDDFLTRATVGPVPGWLMVLLGMLFNGALIGIAIITASRLTASGEIVTPYEKVIKSQAKRDHIEGYFPREIGMPYEKVIKSLSHAKRDAKRGKEDSLPSAR